MKGQVENPYPFLPGRGSLLRRIILFSLPLIGSGVLQQSFNSVDVAVVGRFIGPEALAAVGANGPVVSLLVTLLMGIAVGVNVVVARLLGAGDGEGVRRAVATQAVVAAACAVALTVAGLVLARPLLELLSTPPEILPRATRYLKVYALGFPFMFFYNFASAVLRSAGDTRRPFYWLVWGGLLNVALNLLLVLVCGMGVEGVALATVAGNALAAWGVVRRLTREKGSLKLRPGRLKVYRPQLVEMLRIGLPAGLQGSLFALSNVIIQSAINGFGARAMAGSAAALIFELYGYFVISAIVQAALTFIAAARGAGRPDLYGRLMWTMMAVAVAGSAAVNLTVAAWPEPFCSLFTDHPEALDYAVQRVRGVLMFQFLACSYELSGAALRALGHSLLPMLVTVGGTCVLRVLWVLAYRPESFAALMPIYPITWVVTGAVMLLAWRIVTQKMSDSGRAIDEKATR